MSYKQSTDANRDALFGSAGGKKKKSKAGGGRDELFGGAGKKSSKSKSSSASSSSASTRSSSQPTTTKTVPTSKGYKYDDKKKKSGVPTKPSLSGEAKAAKMKEAEDFRDKAKKAMSRSLFSSPDPLAASTYYKRAADAYQLCGEFRFERLYRINSADCQMAVAAYATAAAEYTRAAELLETADDEELETKREIGRKLHLNAAEAWKNLNEPSKAASSKVQGALALLWGDDSTLLPKLALAAIEEAVEAHVPDPLNPYARYRQTGVSAYIDPDSDETAEKPSQDTLDFARQHIVSKAYAHEPVNEIVNLFVHYGEYASALYAAGAVSTILANDGVSTLSLSRAFVVETILTLAMGDPILAEESFLGRHVQKSSYLSSRECKLAEELFRAVKTRDGEALEEARSPSGPNKSALANLHESVRELVSMIRLSGVARRGVTETYSKKEDKSESSGPSLQELASRKTGYEVEGGDDSNAAGASAKEDPVALQDELDALDFGDDSSLEDDDDIDLR